MWMPLPSFECSSVTSPSLMSAGAFPTLMSNITILSIIHDLFLDFKKYLWSHRAHFVTQAEVVLSLDMRCKLVAAIWLALSVVDDFRIRSSNWHVNIQKASLCNFESESQLQQVQKIQLIINLYLCAGRNFFMKAFFFMRVNFDKIRICSAYKQPKKNLHFLKKYFL